MPRRWNLDPFPVVVDAELPAIQPGEPHDFTDEQIKAGITGNWSKTDPRAKPTRPKPDRAPTHQPASPEEAKE